MPNADLWAEVVAQLRLRTGKVVVRKVTAHMALADMARGAVGAQDFFGNAWADALAGRHAELKCIDINVERRVQRYDALAAKVSTRLVAANSLALEWAAEHEARDHQRVPKGRAKYVSRLKGILERSAHVLDVAAERWLGSA